MKVSINVTQDKKNREKLISTAVQVMAVGVTGHFHSKTNHPFTAQRVNFATRGL